jgi:serine phosphatase RsbU (regulator of sigma subunit)
MREQFGVERLVQLVLQYGSRSPQDLRNAIVDTVHQFSANQLPNDDITALIVKI